MSTKLFFEGEESEFEQFIQGQQYSSYILLADAKTNGYCVPLLKRIIPSLSNSLLIIIPDGEQNKNCTTCELVWDELNRMNASRKSLLINVGGGMVSDLGGFAASVFKRGIDTVHIPTTLLSMVDASHGGKTGIDFNHTKNMIGTYHPAKSIYINTLFLQTLSERNLLSGTAEMIKHALLDSEEYWNEIQFYSLNDFSQIDAIQHSIAIKNRYVNDDIHDNGIRQALNFGHSIGHAIESHSLTTPQPLLHGEAIILGMEVELQLSRMKLQLDNSVIEQFHSMRRELFPSLTQHFDTAQLLPFLKNDKKNEDGFTMSLIKKPGEPIIKVSVSKTEINEANQ
jgi:3-dehydroquinate synthase